MNRITAQERNRKILKYLRNQYANHEMTGIRFDPTITVKCLDNSGKEYDEQINSILYYPVNDWYEIRNIYGQRVPFSYIENPEVIIERLNIK